MKDPTPCSSITSCWRDAPQNGSRLARGAWRLLLLLLLSPGLVKFYVPLLGLQATVANMASHSLSVCLLGLSILWCSSLQLGGGLALILTWKLCMEVLIPIQQALWQPLIIAWAWVLQQLAALIHGTRHGVLRLLQWEAGLVLLSVAQWAYYGLASFCHENSKALEKLLWAVSPFHVHSAGDCISTGSLPGQAVDGPGVGGPGCEGHIEFHQPGAKKWARLSGATSKDLDAVISILPATTVPFSQRFPGPDLATLSRFMPASVILCVVGGDKDASKKKGGCSFGATKVPISARFQIDRRSKQTLAQQVKVTCVLIVLLYIYATTLFVQILK